MSVNDLCVDDNGLVLGGNASVGVQNGGLAADGVYDVHTLGNVAKAGVKTVKRALGGVLVDDEELGSGAVVVVAKSCHGHCAAGVGQVVGNAVGVKLALYGLAGAAGTVTSGVAALNNEAGVDSVDGEPVHRKNRFRPAS